LFISSFPWYDLPSVQWANDRLWQATGLAGRFVRDIPPGRLWKHADLLVTQACGLDLFLAEASIEPVAVPVFDLDCTEGMYYSHIVGSNKDGVAAVNSISSRSGMSALFSTCSPSAMILTGSHVESLVALQTGKAEIAAIDAVTWGILEQHTPQLLAGIGIIERSKEAPAPPFVIGAQANPQDVRMGLATAMKSVDTAAARRVLRVQAVNAINREAYCGVLEEYQAIVPRLRKTQRVWNSKGM